MKKVERWGVFQIETNGEASGNPFVEREIIGTFRGEYEEKTVRGFYNGNGSYIVRFMPAFTGKYEYCITGNYGGEGFEGSFMVTEPSVDNHGPVYVHGTYHFAYGDGTSCYPIGTTCYVWHLQSDERIQETLDTLENSAFNKIRFCVLPKHYDYNLGEPRSYPYEGTPMDSSVLTKDNFHIYSGKTEGNHFDFERFNPEYFSHIEYCLMELQKRGIEADLILFHAYDRWGFSCMSPEQDALYIQYVAARFSAFRNIWWAVANEFDLLKDKTTADWERIAHLLANEDPYHHLRSIHNGVYFYDHSRPWITHCSIQRKDIYKTSEYVNAWRERYQKPIVLDEIAYEGNIQYGWGNINGREMTRRFWEAICRGGYPGHGETFMNPQNVLWWSHGGKLHGESPSRIRFMLEVLRKSPCGGLSPYEKCGWDEVCAVPENEAALPQKSYYLFYYSFMCPSFREFYFDDSTEYAVSVIDTWEMTIEKRGIYIGHFKVNLPAKPFMAVQVKAESK